MTSGTDLQQAPMILLKAIESLFGCVSVYHCVVYWWMLVGFLITAGDISCQLMFLSRF